MRRLTKFDKKFIENIAQNVSKNTYELLDNEIELVSDTYLNYMSVYRMLRLDIEAIFVDFFIQEVNNNCLKICSNKKFGKLIEKAYRKL